MPTFDTPNSTSTWTVPDGVSTIIFELHGAGGGAASYPRQPGGYASGEYPIAGGSEITVYVGEGGEDGSTSEFQSGGGGGQSPLANGGGGEAGFQGTGGGGGGATAIEAPDGTLIAVADAAGGSGVNGTSNVTPIGGGGGARGGAGGGGAGDAGGSGLGGDGGAGGDNANVNSSPGGDGGATVASGVTNATTTTGGGTTGDGVVTLAVPLSWAASTVGVTSTADGTGLVVTWTDDPSVDTYTVEYREAGTSAWVTAASLSAPASEYTITGLTQGTTYEVRVTAAAAIESTTSPVRTATTLLPAPTDLQATGTTATSLSVAWTRHHTTGQTRVECKPTDESQWGAAAPGGAETTVAFDATQATLSGLRNAERYDVRVVAVAEDAERVDVDGPADYQVEITNLRRVQN